jgi:bifunctional non-homologous end joining protein LigD
MARGRAATRGSATSAVVASFAEYLAEDVHRHPDVHIPLDGSDAFDDVRAFAKDLARLLVEREPDRLTIEQRKANRKGRLFVDWLRNSYGQHAVAPYSLRALPGAPVAVPLESDEATSGEFEPRRYRLSNVFRRLGRKRDPWQGMNRHARSIAGLTRR